MEAILISPPAPLGENLTREPADGGLREEGEDAAHETRAGERGRSDGTQDLLHKEQQVGLQGEREGEREGGRGGGRDTHYGSSQVFGTATHVLFISSLQHVLHWSFNVYTAQKH